MINCNPASIEDVRKVSNEHDWEKYYTLRSNDIYVEAGAFWGKYGTIASLKGCKAILIEPEPSNIATIKQMIKFDNLKNVILIEKAVSNKKCIEGFYANRLGGSHLSPKNPNDTNDNIIEIQMDTLDNILMELKIDYVDLLCCDVEGAEIDLIKGAHKYLSEKRIKNLALACYHNEEYHKVAINILKSYSHFGNLVYEDGIVYGRLII